ncbi:MAG: hypothetical protein KatS3mg113_0568 [Planctomycetaceae bacterium]|nr:MAG: hypothetical protein KatS3mg113_0568 [Planctomycetaceae bacterium]
MTQHSFNTPGKRKIKITVGEPPYGPTEREWEINIIDLGVRLNPVNTVVFVETPCPLSCLCKGPLVNIEWIIDGRAYEGKPRRMQDQLVSELEFRFDTPGEHRVKVRGLSEKAIVESEELFIKVLDRPKLQITQPQHGKELYFGETLHFTGSVSGPIEEVTWVLVNKSSGKILQQSMQPIKPAEWGMLSEYQTVFDEFEAGIDLEVQAKGKLLDAYAEDYRQLQISEPVALAQYRLTFKPLILMLSLPEVVSPTQLVSIDMQPNDKLLELELDFGDGTRHTDVSNLKPRHAFEKLGEHVVKVRAKASGGREVLEQRTLIVQGEPPRAQAAIQRQGKPITRVYVGDQLELIDRSTGDIRERRWFLNDQPLEQKFFAPRTAGKHTLKLAVVGYPYLDGRPAPEDQTTLELLVFNPPNLAAFWSLVLVLFGGLGFWVYWFTGNGPRHWELYYSPKHKPEENADREKLLRHWSLWSKRAEIPMKRLLGVYHEYWSSGPGQREKIIISRLKLGKRIVAHLRYSGEGNDRVQLEQVDNELMRQTYKLIDNRCPDQNTRIVFFAIQQTEKGNLPHILLLLAGLIVGVIVVVWAYQRFLAPGWGAF